MVTGVTQKQKRIEERFRHAIDLYTVLSSSLQSQTRMYTDLCKCIFINL